MTDKVAIVTGGNRGIGRAIADRLMADGFKIGTLDMGPKEDAQSLRDAGGHPVHANVSDLDAVQAAVAEIEGALGPASVLVNNAGITRDGFLHKMDAEAWNAVINVNLNSCFNTCRAVVPGMRERKYGRIINISSINGQKGQFGQTNYSAAKAGMIGFTKALAQEGATKGITVNAVCPGYIATEMTKAMPPEVLEGIVGGVPMGRLGEPGEIAAVVAFLASDDAAFITGATLSANGGQYMA